MIETTYSFDEIEEPPSCSFQSIKTNFSKIIQNPLFAKFIDRTLLSIVFVRDSQMQELNKQYRGKDATTDVLTFPFNEKLENGYLLGEIIISMDKAKVDADSFNISLLQEILILMVHGITHLLGHDHKNDQQEIEMKEIENKLMNQISISKGALLNG